MAKPGIPFWIVSIFAILFNGFGVVDYIMTVTGNEDYLAQYTEEQLAYWEGLPAWRTAVWAVGVFGALVASVLLLLRQGLAAPLFAVAALMVLVTAAADIAGGFDVVGMEGVIGYGVIFVFQAFFWWYAARQKRLGVLSPGR